MHKKHGMGGKSTELIQTASLKEEVHPQKENQDKGHRLAELPHGRE